jgi:hypothetical protein
LFGYICSLFNNQINSLIIVHTIFFFNFHTTFLKIPVVIQKKFPEYIMKPLYYLLHPIYCSFFVSGSVLLLVVVVVEVVFVSDDDVDDVCCCWDDGGDIPVSC